ncbi:recombination-associated protein RdgC [Basilea psittacipulmonis]|uniref:Recombination-associated protein RdgC n=1 Tax=Basilea psittacipulmonis DSM 24701 TaxID=1072685 RepID=A0A077DH34_9BURK|nr:recombination-associated protein RdgC [Basilea psittacipulmonis]AIL32737.1 hypothetical protein IX83_04935 [Basilea psittacipulmonis DSM 24701]
MWFKNLKVYRLTKDWNFDLEGLKKALSNKTFVPGEFSDNKNDGWMPVFKSDDSIVHHVNGQYFLKFCSETKLLPASVIRQVAAQKAQEIEERQGFKPGRKQMKEIRDEVEFTLRPQAFSIFRYLSVWIDPINRWLVIDTASASKADAVIATLSDSLSPLPLEMVELKRSPTSAMSEWLLEEAPSKFTIDSDAELTSINESRAKIRYVHHRLDDPQIKTLLQTDKCCTKLALTWKDKVSFLLTDNGDIKRVFPIDILEEDEYHSDMDEVERYDVAMTLMATELSQLLTDLYSVLSPSK